MGRGYWALAEFDGASGPAGRFGHVRVAQTGGEQVPLRQAEVPVDQLASGRHPGGETDVPESSRAVDAGGGEHAVAAERKSPYPAQQRGSWPIDARGTVVQIGRAHV